MGEALRWEEASLFNADECAVLGLRTFALDIFWLIQSFLPLESGKPRGEVGTGPLPLTSLGLS